MKILIAGVLILFTIQIYAQKVPSKKYPDKAYFEVVSKRAGKIVESLAISDPEMQKRVQDIIAFQYYDLNKIHDKNKADIQLVKDQVSDEKLQKEKIEKLKSQADLALLKLHKSYLERLQRELTGEQIETVKNGMTYNVFVNTYAGYLNMLQNLTDEQKKFIYDALLEAREKAMDAGSSNEKHAWFGKYKGRINNYLSKAGYDLNKESKDWHERIKERENH